ncbi:uncharacterized protein LOC134859572 [Eleginops maclovinus]|uniref:uncharacterized protein LOC134859572 n=1 Tax=Eleginops maclovinus TaxID=56733 RepID=UPI00308043B8
MKKIICHSVRSFPGYFKSDFRRGKKRCLTAAKHLVKTSIKTTALHFYLLPKNISHTPLPTEELELLQAGMGRQTLTLPEDGDHAEISRLLADTFPKMEGLCGGWLLHKATGGSGRRKLTVIPPEAEGCSVKALRAMSAGGKVTFYIVPLQETLDTSPLPPDSHCFSKMPKKTFFQCNEVMPLQMLAVHIRTCNGKLSSDETVDEVVCPICTKEFPEDEITVHASLCGACQGLLQHITIVQLHLLHLQYANQKVRKMYSVYLNTKLTSQQNLNCVWIERAFQTGAFSSGNGKKAASPTSTLKVVYIGEAGIDTGAIRKEFLTDMVSGIENRFFEGAGSQGKNPEFSLTDLDNDNFRTIGEIMAVSIAQGGPPPAFFRAWCYNFLCTGEVDFHSLSKEDVSDLESCLLISKRTF